MAGRKRAKNKAKIVGGFEDLHFKMSVISALMEEGHFVAEAEKLKARHGASTEDYRAISNVMEYYSQLEIPKNLLESITSLMPDGGDLAYVNAVNVWDGEDDLFDIRSLGGIEQLVNLERFEPIAMMSQDGVDYRPLLACTKLRKVDVTFADDSGEAVAAELKRRGVEVIE